MLDHILNWLQWHRYGTTNNSKSHIRWYPYQINSTLPYYQITMVHSQVTIADIGKNWSQDAASWSAWAQYGVYHTLHGYWITHVKNLHISLNQKTITLTPRPDIQSRWGLHKWYKTHVISWIQEIFIYLQNFYKGLFNNKLLTPYLGGPRGGRQCTISNIKIVQEQGEWMIKFLMAFLRLRRVRSM